MVLGASTQEPELHRALRSMAQLRGGPPASKSMHFEDFARASSSGIHFKEAVFMKFSSCFHRFHMALGCFWLL